MRIKLTKGTFALVVVVLGVALAIWWWQKPAKAIPPETIEVVAEDIEHVVTAIGSLQPRDYVDVGAQVSGQLQALHVDVGDEVKQGDLLAEIDADVQEARVAGSRAQLLALEAQLRERNAQRELAELQWQRQQRLAKDRATSEEALQSAKAQVETVRAQIDAVEAQIEQHNASLKDDEANLGSSKIAAPLSGTVVDLEARLGQPLTANQQAPILMRIADLNTMTVWTEVSEADVNRLTVGMPVYFSPLGNAQKRWHSTLRQVLPTPEEVNNVILYTALFDVENDSGELMTDMTAQVFFVLAQADEALTVPASALFEREGKTWVQVLNAKGVPEDRPVKAGINNRVKVEILEGLEEGEQVLVHPQTGTSPQGGAGRRGLAGVRL